MDASGRNEKSSVLCTCSNCEVKPFHFTKTTSSWPPQPLLPRTHNMTLFANVVTLNTSEGSPLTRLRRAEYLHEMNSSVIPDRQKM